MSRPSDVARRIGFCLLVTLFAACSGSGAEPAIPGAADASAASTPAPDVPDDGEPAVPGEVEDLSGFELGIDYETTDILGLVTPSGVTVAVAGLTNGGYVVATPCGDIGLVSSGRPLQNITVVLDPGHGGPIDTGAVGPGGLVERDLNLEVAEATQDELEARGISVALTRTADYAVPLAVRANFADKLEAELMVSIHHNAPTPQLSSTPGTEVFVQSDSPDSARAGALVHEGVASALAQFDIEWSAAADSGPMTVLNSRGTDAYGMIAYPGTVTVLAEMGYLSNPAEETLFGSADYLQVAAVALADSVEAYLAGDEPVQEMAADASRTYDPQRAPGRSVCTNPELE